MSARRAGMSRMGRPSERKTRSSTRRPAAWAGEPSTTSTTRAPRLPSVGDWPRIPSQAVPTGSPSMSRWATNTTVSLGMAKPRPMLPPAKIPPLRIEVFMPITRPWRSASGPPELPGLIGASVWIMATPAQSAPGPFSQPYESMTRPSADTMPLVTVRSRSNGLPRATANWPTRRSSVKANTAGTRPSTSSARSRTATSRRTSTPTISADTSRPLGRLTTTSSAPSTTWALVTIRPRSRTIPEPRPWSGTETRTTVSRSASATATTGSSPESATGASANSRATRDSTSAASRPADSSTRRPTSASTSVSSRPEDSSSTEATMAVTSSALRPTSPGSGRSSIPEATRASTSVRESPGSAPDSASATAASTRARTSSASTVVLPSASSSMSRTTSVAVRSPPSSVEPSPRSSQPAARPTIRATTRPAMPATPATRRPLTATGGSIGLTGAGSRPGKDVGSDGSSRSPGGVDEGSGLESDCDRGRGDPTSMLLRSTERGVPPSASGTSTMAAKVGRFRSFHDAGPVRARVGAATR